MLEEKPSIRPSPHKTVQCVSAGKPITEELEGDPVVTPAAWQIGTAVPNREPTGAVLPPPNLTLEVTNTQVEILNRDGQTTQPDGWGMALRSLESVDSAAR
jgi:hypothetical protein